MEMIETIFVCLPNAFKGTIYRVGKIPELKVERITSGLIDGFREKIEWGMPVMSGYTSPGKPWLEHRDEPDGVSKGRKAGHQKILQRIPEA